MYVTLFKLYFDYMYMYLKATHGMWLAEIAKMDSLNEKSDCQSQKLDPSKHKKSPICKIILPQKVGVTRCAHLFLSTKLQPIDKKDAKTYSLS